MFMATCFAIVESFVQIGNLLRKYRSKNSPRPWCKLSRAQELQEHLGKE